jgi:hypothetical protein
MSTTAACPNCGSTSAQRLVQPDTDVCANVSGCDARRCRRRKEEDRKRFRGRRYVQCHATTGGRTTLFCELGEGHDGLHQHGTREWSGDYEAPIATALRALRDLRRTTRSATT